MLRKVLFWMHLTAGVTAGMVILIMSATGAALTYERQISEWTLSHLRSVQLTPDARPLAVEDLLAVVRRDHPDRVLTGLTVSARPDGPVAITTEPIAPTASSNAQARQAPPAPQAPLYVDSYTGQQLGERRNEGLRAFLAEVRSWHRYLATDGDNRPFGKAITGWSNALFLFIVVSGMYLWVPRVWTWIHVQGVLMFHRDYGTSKARDFNWHNVIGIWSAVPLFIVVLGAVPISFPWASDLVYRVVGDEPPPRSQPGGRGPAAGAGSRAEGGRQEGGAPAGGDRRNQPENAVASRNPEAGLNGLFERAAKDQPGWKTINLRLPRTEAAPVVFAIDRGDGGQPQLRSSLTLGRDGQVVARETFGDQSPGRQLRSVLRFAHTGEVLGLPGQTIAGLASAGGVVMVYTGLALTWRRFRAWVSRRRVAPEWVQTGSQPSTAVLSSRPSEESFS